MKNLPPVLPPTPKNPEECFTEEELKVITRSYGSLLRTFKTPLIEEDQKLIRRAFELAVSAHGKQRRRAGEPYILHPIAVARICIEEIGLGPTAAVVALLHDVVEDTHITLKDLEEQGFGKRICMMVDGLTKLDKAYKADSPQAENIKKILVYLSEDVRVMFIKMADRLHNMRTIGSMKPEKQQKIAAETSYIYIPLAHRLGLYKLKTELEELCMQVTDKDVYEEINRKLHETKAERQGYIDDFCKPIKKELDTLGVPYRITGRPKSTLSIANKIRSKNIPFEDIYDLFAIRIILSPEAAHKESALCWYAYTHVVDIYTPVPGRLKDWVSHPKSNGYESLHTTVVGPLGRFVEVQIRTERMEDIAERGYAAHWKYKGVGKQGEVYEQFLEQVREKIKNPESDTIGFLSDFTQSISQEEVCVFSKDGDMITMPKGATALDFAFQIHSDVGYHCNGVLINDEMVPMSTKLRNGDQLKIITSKRQKPNESWLKIVVTSKARNRIRQALKQQQHEQSEIGKEALQRKLKALKVNESEKTIDFLMKHFGFKIPSELYYNIAIETVDLQRDLKGFKVENGRFVEIDLPARIHLPLEEKENAATVVAEGSGRVKPKLIIAGQPADLYEYSFSSCCSPVVGDEIFAFQTLGQGYKIHRTTCPNATNMRATYDYRIHKAEWTHIVNTSFVAEVVIIGIDGPGVLESLSSQISSGLGLDIRSFSISVNAEGYYEGRVRLVVVNADQLNRVIIALKGIQSVTKVKRA